MNALTPTIATCFPLNGNDTSRDPAQFHIYQDPRTEVCEVWRNTGRGWVFVSDHDSRSRAEERVAEMEEQS